MKSDIYNQNDGIDHILDETERLGIFCRLSPTEAMKLRLLAEEVLGLTVRLFDDIKYELFIVNEGRSYTINLTVDTIVDLRQKDKMLSLSSRGENIAAKGVLGKISGIFEDTLMCNNAYSPSAELYSLYHGKENTDICFSLMYYQNQIPENEKDSQWDGLEKSIIAHFAEDVTIGVKSDKVEVVASITF